MRRRPFIRHPVLFVVLVAAGVRLWTLADLPLVITNDGVWYLAWARDVLSGRFDTIPAVRTPGYPVFLAGVFKTMGIGGLGVLAAQHAVGVGTAVVLTLAILRRHGRRWAIGLGTIAAVSPSLMLWECYALTETLAVFLAVAAFAIALCARPGRAWALVLGLTLGLACLVRPTMQILVPFFVLGWALRASGRPGREGLARGAVGALIAVIGVGAMTGPWLVHNAQRGVTGLARGGGVSAFWWGMAMNDALDRSYPLPPGLRGAAERLPRGRANDDQLGKFLEETGALGDPELEGVLSGWARSSARSRPGAYARGAVRALGGQLEIRRGAHSDTGWLLWRLSQDGRAFGQAAGNYQVSVDSRGLEDFRMSGGRGWGARAAEWLARHKAGGVPRVLLLLGAVIAGIVVRRRLGEALVIAGTGALFMVHAAMLLPHGRYGVTACACWVVLVPEAVGAVERLLRGFRAARVAGRKTPPT